MMEAIYAGLCVAIVLIVNAEDTNPHLLAGAVGAAVMCVLIIIWEWRNDNQRD